MVRVLFFMLSLYVVQHGSSATDPSSGSTTTPIEPTLHIGKSFAHNAKLVKDNYTIWMAGIITILMSYS